MSKRVKVFQNPGEAYYYMENSKEPLVVIMGDFPNYWVTNPRHAQELLNEGYCLESEGEEITREDLNLLGPIRRFYTLEHAINVQNLNHLPYHILVGDDDHYWLLLPADSKKLFSIGFEIPSY
jgi:hypothetical protein